jgi:hypothetical protein
MFVCVLFLFHSFSTAIPTIAAAFEPTTEPRTLHHALEQTAFVRMRASASSTGFTTPFPGLSTVRVAESGAGANDAQSTPITRTERPVTTTASASISGGSAGAGAGAGAGGASIDPVGPWLGAIVLGWPDLPDPDATGYALFMNGVHLTSDTLDTLRLKRQDVAVQPCRRCPR